MKIYILIKPWDYSSAEVEVFRTRKEAEDAKNEAIDSTAHAHYWMIQERDFEHQTAGELKQ